MANIVTPVRQYNLVLNIKNDTEVTDYSPDLISARIITTITSPYPIVVLDLFVDADELTSGRISAKSEISLEVNLSGDIETLEPISKDTVQYDLMLLKFGFLSSPSEVVRTPEQRRIKDRSQVSLICLCKGAFKIATTLINAVYVDTTIPEILQDVLINKVEGVKDVEIDRAGINEERIDQFVIPPMPLYKFFQYLDFTFGIYDGIPEFHISHDNVVHITNLSKVLNKEQVITVWQLHLDDPAGASKAEDLAGDGNNFYTYAPIKTENNVNSKFSSISTDLKYIVKPKDQLFFTIEKDLTDVASNFGVIYKNTDISVNPATSRTKYRTDHTGFETSEIFADALTSKNLFNLMTVSISIERNMHISTLIKIANPVKLVTESLQYLDLSGKYVLRTSDIRFVRESSWNGTARLDLARTSDKVGYRN